jgi:ribosome biogenesis GTPase
MTLAELGYNEDLNLYRQEQNLQSYEIGRIVAEHRERYIVLTENHELEAEIIGHLRFSASDRTGFPAVGDWVAICGRPLVNLGKNRSLQPTLIMH